MVDIIKVLNSFILRIFQGCLPFVKIRMNRQIHIPINRRAQDTAAMFSIKIRNIASASAEADTEWGFGDYHNLTSFSIFVQSLP